MGEHHFVPARARIAAAIATIVGITGVAVAFGTEPTAGAFPSARRHIVSPKAPPARIPLDAAVAARARAQAEQTMRDFQAAQEAQQRAAYLAVVAEYYRPKTNVNWDGIARCETGGNWSMRGASFSGGLGFYNGTWSSFGGRRVRAQRRTRLPGAADRRGRARVRAVRPQRVGLPSVRLRPVRSG